MNLDATSIPEELARSSRRVSSRGIVYQGRWYAPSVHIPPSTVVLVRPTTDAVIALEVLLPSGIATKAVLVGEGGVL